MEDHDRDDGHYCGSLRGERSITDDIRADRDPVERVLDLRAAWMDRGGDADCLLALSAAFSALTDEQHVEYSRRVAEGENYG